MSGSSAIPTSRLDGKVALVTGSGRGMGRENALELARRGASVVINYSRASGPAETVIKEIQQIGSQGIAIKADVTKPVEIASMFEQAIEHYGHLDIVVSNSGVESFGHISEITAEEFDRVFAVNTRGQLLVAQQAFKHLSNGGRLVMLSSISAQAKGVANHAIYSGSKGAIEALARCLAVGDNVFLPNPPPRERPPAKIFQISAQRTSPSMPSPPVESRPTCTTKPRANTSLMKHR